MVSLGLSVRKMDLARRIIPGMFASRDKVNDWLKKQAPPTKLINGNQISIVSLKESIKMDIINLFIKYESLRSRTHHIIKIGGDGTTDIGEANKQIRHILVLAYAYHDIGSISLDHSHGIIATAWMKESIQSIHAMAKEPNKEIIDLIIDGLEINGVKHTFQFLLCGDMKWLRMAYGLNGCRSIYCCPHCVIQRNELINSYTSTRELMKWDDEKHLRSCQSMYDEWEKKVSEEKTRMHNMVHKNIHRKPKGARHYKGQKAQPSFTIETWLAPTEQLHMIICLVKRYEKIWIHMAGIMGELPHQCAKYLAQLRRIGVNRSITGLTGQECKRVLALRIQWAQPLHKHKDHAALISSMGHLDELINMPMTQLEFREHSMLFAMNCIAEFPKFFSERYYTHTHTHTHLRSTQPFNHSIIHTGSNHSLYLHQLAVHAYKWHPIIQWSTSGLEKMNHQLKIAKQHTVRDRLIVSDDIHSAAGALTQIHNRYNQHRSGLLVTPLSRRSVGHCTACGSDTHYKSNRACPQHSLHNTRGRFLVASVAASSSVKH
jgi:hypothetical protein